MVKYFAREDMNSSLIKNNKIISISFQFSLPWHKLHNSDVHFAFTYGEPRLRLIHWVYRGNPLRLYIAPYRLLGSHKVVVVYRISPRYHSLAVKNQQFVEYHFGNLSEIK